MCQYPRPERIRGICYSNTVTEIEMCANADDSCYMYHLRKEIVQCESRLLRDNAALKESKNQRNHIVEHRVQTDKDTHRALRRKVM